VYSTIDSKWLDDKSRRTIESGPQVKNMESMYRQASTKFTDPQFNTINTKARLEKEKSIISSIEIADTIW
jgi:CRISPR/Cas system CSM-associated protein Csm3 (group 7 of RAMP superfamily)